MTSKTDESFRAIQALWRVLDLAAIEGADVGVEDLGAVERDLDLLALNFDLLGVPLAHGAEVAVLCTDAVIDAAVVLIGL